MCDFSEETDSTRVNLHSCLTMTLVDPASDGYHHGGTRVEHLVPAEAI